MTYDDHLIETGSPAAAGALALRDAIEDQQRALTIDQVAKMLRCSRRQVYRLCAAGKIRHARIGNRGVRFNRQAVADFLAGGQ